MLRTSLLYILTKLSATPACLYRLASTKQRSQAISNPYFFMTRFIFTISSCENLNSPIFPVSTSLFRTASNALLFLHTREKSRFMAYSPFALITENTGLPVFSSITTSARLHFPNVSYFPSYSLHILKISSIDERISPASFSVMPESETCDER